MAAASEVEPSADGNLSTSARLDALTEQVAFIADELREQRRMRLQMQELAHDLAPVTQGAMDMATARLTDLDDDINLEDVGRLARTLIRNINQLEAAVAQLESLASLGQAVSALAGPAMTSVTAQLQVLEDKGYFECGRQGAAVVDRVVTAFSPDDFDDLAAGTPPSLFALLKQMRTPEARRGLAGALTVLRAVGAADPQPSNSART